MMHAKNLVLRGISCFIAFQSLFFAGQASGTMSRLRPLLRPAGKFIRPASSGIQGHHFSGRQLSPFVMQRAWVSTTNNSHNFEKENPESAADLSEHHSLSHRDAEKLLNSDEFSPVMRKIMKEELEDFRQRLRDEGEWDIEYARTKVIKELMDQGLTREEAQDKFEEMDRFIDHKRRMLKLPYFAGVAFPAAGIPATWALVYHKPFYTWVTDKWPWLTDTSWDWSEPLVQSALTTETGAALMLGSIAALGYRSYNRYVNKKLTSQFAEIGNISKKTSEKFIKVDK